MPRSKKYRIPLILQNFCRLAVLALGLLSLWIGNPFSLWNISLWNISLWDNSLVAWAEAMPAIEAAPEIAEPDPNRTGLGTDAIAPEKVGQFVRAYLHVVTLIEQREGEMQGAETDAESLRIQQEIEAEALSLIEAEGLTLQEYMQLLSLANIDPEFGDRIALQLQEAIN
jgi:hypothetical protein